MNDLEGMIVGVIAVYVLIAIGKFVLGANKASKEEGWHRDR